MRFTSGPILSVERPGPAGTVDSAGVKIAHVRERNAPAGSPGGSPPRATRAQTTALAGPEVGRRQGRPLRGSALSAQRVLFRQPITTLDDAPGPRPARGSAGRGGGRYAAARRPTRRSSTADLAFGPPILRPPSLRDFYAFERHVATMWERRGGTVPEAWYRLPIFYFSNVSEIRGPESRSGPGGVAGARLRAGGGGADRHAGAATWPRRAARRRSAGTWSSTTGRRATCSATRRRYDWGRPRARTSPARSVHGWSPRTSWPTRVRATAMT